MLISFIVGCLMKHSQNAIITLRFMFFFFSFLHCTFPIPSLISFQLSVSFQCLLFPAFNSSPSIPSLQFQPFLSQPSILALHFPAFNSSPSFPSLQFQPFLSQPSIPALLFPAFYFTSFNELFHVFFELRNVLLMA